MTGNTVVQRIEYLSVIGGFLDGLRVSFGSGLNTIIGARGTGKTTVIECIAYALDTLPNSDHAPQERKRVETLMKRNLNGGRIEVGIRAKDGTAYKVTRSYGEEPIVVDEDGVTATVNLKAGVFRADVFGQNAVESIADRPLFQLDLVDNFASHAIQQASSREKHIVSMLAANAHQIIPLEQEVGAIYDELAGLPTVEQKLKGFAGPAGGATDEVNVAHRLKGLRDRETRSLQWGRESIGQLVQSLRQLQGGLQGRSGSLFDAETAQGSNGDVLQEVSRRWSNCSGDVDRLLLQAVDRLASLNGDLTHLSQRPSGKRSGRGEDRQTVETPFWWAELQRDREVEHVERDGTAGVWIGFVGRAVGLGRAEAASGSRWRTAARGELARGGQCDLLPVANGMCVDDVAA